MANNNGARAILRAVESDSEVSKATRPQKSKDFLASYFLKVKNQEELFRLGRDFSVQLKTGVKNFAMTSPGLMETQQNTILGLCCFFDRVEHLKIAIVSTRLSQGVFNELVENSHPMAYHLESSNFEMKYSTYFHHFDFFDYNSLLDFYNMHFYSENFDKDLEKIFVNYDLIFWDLPSLPEMKKSPHFYYRISSFYQTMTLIISPHSMAGQIEELRNYFKNYNLNLSRVLFDATSEEKPEKKKKIFGMF